MPGTDRECRRTRACGRSVGDLRSAGWRFARWAALGASVVGALALALGLSRLSLAEQSGDYSVFVGSSLVAANELPTFDISLGNLAHAAFPWSAAAPLGLALICRRTGDDPRERNVVNAAALGLSLSLLASAWLSPSLGGLVLPGICCFAVLIAGSLGALERGELGSPLLGLVVAALGIIIGFDLREYPGEDFDRIRSRQHHVARGLTDQIRAPVGGWCVRVGRRGCAVFLRARDQPPDNELPAFQPAEYRRVLAALQQVWDGNLVFTLLVVEAALVGFLVLSAISERLVALPQLDDFGSFWQHFRRGRSDRGAAAAPFWCSAPCWCVTSDARCSAGACPDRCARRTNAGRGRSPGVRCVRRRGQPRFYPAFARQISPTEAFERYRELRRAQEPLGVLGEQAGAARYQGAPDAQSLDGVDDALAWLTEEPPRARRFLVIRKADLPELNAQFRELHAQNLPVLDARSSEVLLASNQLLSGERDQNPLAELVRNAPPPIQHPLHAVLGEQLEVLGWSVRSTDGVLQTSVVPTERYRFSIYYRVVAPPNGSWQTFVHIDGLQRRFNADHEPLDGKYPLRLWRPNDVIVDTTDVVLEPNFSPGPYRVYFGLFSGDRRLHVTEGAADEDRIVAGTLQVR